MKTEKSRNPFLIEVTSRTPLPFSKVRLTVCVKKILTSLKFKRAHLSILFAKDAEVRRWHKRLMKRTSATDVISISQFESRTKGKEPNPLNSLGDVIICVDRAKRHAKEAGCSLSEELLRCVNHGILHCLGHRDQKPSEREKMWSLQEKLVGKYKKLLLN